MEQLAARRAHNPKVGGSSPPPATLESNRMIALFFSFGTHVRGFSLLKTKVFCLYRPVSVCRLSVLLPCYMLIDRCISI